MVDEVDIHFQGIETVAASLDGKLLIFKTLSPLGKPHHIALHADEAAGTILKILTASLQAEKNKAATLPGQTKMISVAEIGLLTSKAQPDLMALSVRFEEGTAPIGLRLTKTPLIRLGLDILQRLAPEKLVKPRPL